MKNAIALICVALLALTVLAFVGCGNEEEPSKKETPESVVEKVCDIVMAENWQATMEYWSRSGAFRENEKWLPLGISRYEILARIIYMK